MQRHACGSYCNCNHAKYMKKMQELKEKGDPESLQYLRDDPLVGIPIDCRFKYPKLLDLNMHLEIT